MNPELLIIIFPIGFAIHLYLCRKFDTKPQKVKTLLLYIYLVFTILLYFSGELNLRILFYLILGWSIVLIDYQHHRIPNFITGFFALALFAFALIDHRVFDSAAGGAEFLSFFGLLAFATKLKIGFGDVKLAGVIGMIVGTATFWELINYVLLAAILGLCSLLANPKGICLKAQIPFAAPMIAASIVIWPMLHMKG